MVPVTKLIEETIAWEAIDGTRFSNKEECKKYEESAMCVAAAVAQTRQINSVRSDDVLGVFCMGGDERVEIYDIKTMEDLQTVNIYLHTLNEINHTREDQRELIDPKYVGHQVIVNIWCDDCGFKIWGTREEAEAMFSKCMDKLFKDGDDNAES